MLKFMLASLLVFAGVDACVNAQNVEVAKRLQAASVLIQVGPKDDPTSGSGTVFQHDGETYVWTNDHVVDEARATKEVNVLGTKTVVTTISQVRVSQKLTGKSVELTTTGEIVRYSDIQTGQDIALLKLPKDNPFKSVSTTFKESDEPPPIGTEVYVVGCPGGDDQRQSVCAGIIAYNDREMTYTIRKTVMNGWFKVVEKKEVNPRFFDQTDTVVAPGNSGGGVFDRETGEFLGILSRRYESNGSGLFIPIRRIREWARTEGVEWALENPQPTLAEPEPIPPLPTIPLILQLQ